MRNISPKTGAGFRIVSTHSQTITDTIFDGNRSGEHGGGLYFLNYSLKEITY